MSDLLQATYHDLKTVKTRGQVQIVLEMPIEALTDVVRLLGAPVAGNEVWVAIARLNLSAAPTEPAQIAHDNDDADEPHRPPMSLAQSAGFLCGTPTFQQFILESGDGWDHRPTKEEAAEWLRSVCGVPSRADIKPENRIAAERFRKIRADYNAWMLVPVPV